MYFKTFKENWMKYQKLSKAENNIEDKRKRIDILVEINDLKHLLVMNCPQTKLFSRRKYATIFFFSSSKLNLTFGVNNKYEHV